MTSLNYVEPPNSNLVGFCCYNHRSCTDSHLDLLYLPVSATCNDGVAQSQIRLDVPQRSVHEPNNHQVMHAYLLSRLRRGSSQTFTALSD